MNGKLFWNKLIIEKITRDPSAPIKFGCIDIHIPIQLNIAYEPMGEIPWFIRTAIHKQLGKLGWPPKDINCLYYFYHADYYHLQIMTHDKTVVEFYQKLLNEQRRRTNPFAQAFTNL